MRILGIETSCDETAAAVLEVKNGVFKVVKNVIPSSCFVFINFYNYISNKNSNLKY